MMILEDGTASLMARQASMPDRFGILTSRRTTSGATPAARVVPSTPSPASPTTSRLGSAARSMVSPRRNSSWSSTTSTRMGSPVRCATSAIMARPEEFGDALRGSGGGEGWPVWTTPARSSVTFASAGRPQIERDHAVVVAATPVDDRGPLALLVHEEVEVVADQLH